MNIISIFLFLSSEQFSLTYECEHKHNISIHRCAVVLFVCIEQASWQQDLIACIQFSLSKKKFALKAKNEL